ncbi:MAG: hypothetical protein FJ397_02440 [Verrucomicrobia bacterium]|nr:hypothetical protein [Verrucomicrobiota bacterium]
MSLINDALKKAQRDRDPLAPTAALGPGGAGRSRPRTPARHWLLLLGSGALVLVVLSVAFTLFWTTPDTPPRKAATAAPAARPASPAPTPAPAPAIVPVLPAARPAPAEVPPAAIATPAVPPAPAVAAAAASSTPTATPARPEAPAAAATPPEPETATSPAPATPATATPAPAPSPVSPTAAAAPATPPRPDEKVAAYIGTLRVAGVRALGKESRVLINERVYRVNEVIERTLGIRLVQVEPGSLHFVDGRGVTYVKYL